MVKIAENQLAKGVGLALVGTVFVSSSVMADILQPGTYACIVEHSGGMFDRKQRISVGNLNLNSGKFIVTARDISDGERLEACQWALNEVSGKSDAPNNLHRTHSMKCAATVEIKVNSQEIAIGNMYGYGATFYGDFYSSALVLLDHDEISFGYLISLAEYMENGSVEQYMFRGRCNKF